MVSLLDMQASNAEVAALHEGLVAVFVGATRGIGLMSLKQFVKHANKPQVYIVARSEESARAVIAECKVLNNEAEFTFIAADVSLIRSVDKVCRDIASKETAINLLFMTPGTLTSGTDTPEGLHFAMSLNYYARTRFTLNLLPLLRVAPGLRRVVTVLAGTKEGQIDASDFPCRKVSAARARGHTSSVITLSLEVLAQKAPEVSFLQVYPSFVKTDLGKDNKSVGMKVVMGIFKVVGPLLYLPEQEVGERQLFFSTSGRFPPKEGDAAGVTADTGVGVATGTDGKIRSGVYSVSWQGDVQGEKTTKLLAKLRDEGVREKLWKHTEDEYARITGS